MKDFRRMEGVMLPVFFVLLAVLVFHPCSIYPREVSLYVSPRGSDEWSGRLREPASDGADGPLASLAGARDAVRGLRREQPETAVRVFFSGGNYSQSDPVVFGPEDGGSEDAPVKYEALCGERPVLSGGRRITGLEEGEDGIWRVHLPEVEAGDWYFEQLWVNGRRAVRARTPSEDWHYMLDKVQEGLDPVTGEKTDLSRRAFVAERDDIEPLLDLSGEELNDVTLVAYHSWSTGLHRVAAVDEETASVYTTGEDSWPLFRWRERLRYPRQRYHLENFRAALTEPGEWFLSREGKLHYIPLPGEEIDEVEVVAPVAEAFIQIEGDVSSGRKVEHLAFRGLSFRHNQHLIPCEGRLYIQTAAGNYLSDPPSVGIGGAITARGARHIRIVDCEIAHTGTYAVWFHESCSHSAIKRSHLHDLGAGGVRIGHGWDFHGGPQRDNPTDEQLTHSITVDNNIIRGGGRIFRGAVGVWIGHSAHNTVTHNSISDLYYTGISVGWRWGYHESRAKQNVIKYNHIHHIGQGVLSDMGGVYTLGPSGGTQITGNLIHDVYSYDHYGRGGWGIYTDQGSCDYIIEKNLVYNTKTGGYHQHYGKDNIVINNIFAESMDGQIQRSLKEDHVSFRFKRNIVFWSNESPLFSSPMKDENVEFGHNLYWNTLGEEYVDFNGLSLEEWRDLPGVKGEGSVIADPLFVDPEAGDYRLRPGSPAFDIGFKEFDFARAGVYGDEEWTDLAQDYEYAPLKLHGPPPPLPPLKVSEDFEGLSAGQPPPGAQVETEGRGDSIAVTQKQSASGDRSLEVRDAAGLEKIFNPHFYYTLNHSCGVSRISFYIKAGEGARMNHQWRTYEGSDFSTGPSMDIEDGLFRADGKDLFRVPPGEWFHIEITAPLGQKTDGTWSLKATVLDQSHSFDNLEFVHEDFDSLDWAGWISNAEDERVFYLDEIEIENHAVTTR